MEQATFAELEHDGKKRTTRREKFLAKMDGLIPWSALERRIEPIYPKPGRGRRPYPLGTMLRVHCVQLFYNLSDPGMEDLLYEVESVRRFAGLRLSGPLPDETTILKFRHLLEDHGLGEALFAEINAQLQARGHRLKRGTIVDASIVDAPSSTKNKAGARGPGDAPGEEGQPVVFWDEGAHWGGFGIGADAYVGDHAGERLGRGAHLPGAARRGVAGVGRRRIPGCGQAPGEPGHGGRLARGDEAGQAAVARQERTRGGGGEAQGVGAGEGGASVLVREAPLRLWQGALPGLGEEHAAHRDAAGFSRIC